MEVGKLELFHRRKVYLNKYTSVILPLKITLEIYTIDIVSIIDLFTRFEYCGINTIGRVRCSCEFSVYPCKIITEVYAVNHNGKRRIRS